jgi:hypothetical protein
VASQGPAPEAALLGPDAAAAHAAQEKRAAQMQQVLSAQDALHIYRARETGKTAAAVCTRLAETYAVHAKVSTPKAARLHRFGPPAAAP